MLIAVVLGEKLGVGYRELDFRRGNYGKPFLDLEQAPAFNVSCSGSVAVCAVADTAVGVDVERMMPMEAETMRLLLGRSEDESAEGISDDAALRFFYRRWTMLESWLKAEGTGLHDGHPLATFAPKPVGAERFLVDAREPGKAPWIVEPLAFDLSVPDRYALAVCRRPEEHPAEKVAWLDEIELERRFRMLL